MLLIFCALMNFETFSIACILCRAHHSRHELNPWSQSIQWWSLYIDCMLKSCCRCCSLYVSVKLYVSLYACLCCEEIFHLVPGDQVVRGDNGRADGSHNASWAAPAQTGKVWKTRDVVYWLMHAHSIDTNDSWCHTDKISEENECFYFLTCLSVFAAGEGEGATLLGTVHRPQQRNPASKVSMKSISEVEDIQIIDQLVVPPLSLPATDGLVETYFMYWFGMTDLKTVSLSLSLHLPQVHPVQRRGVVCETTGRPAAIQRRPPGLEEPAGFLCQPPQLWCASLQGKDTKRERDHKLRA